MTLVLLVIVLTGNYNVSGELRTSWVLGQCVEKAPRFDMPIADPTLVDSSLSEPLCLGIPPAVRLPCKQVPD